LLNRYFHVAIGFYAFDVVIVVCCLCYCSCKKYANPLIVSTVGG